jgi:2-succinyl-6-hydroxy-2,4-cyclohexadiene-1-carboxylate synthase
MSVEPKLFPLIRAGHGPEVVVFLHGFLGAKEDWLPVMSRVTPQADCIALDLPGHGEHRGQVHVPDYAGVIAWLEEARLRLAGVAWHVVGYSLGGRVALAYACAYPAHVRSLTLVSASPGIDDATERAQRRARDADWANDLTSLPPETVLNRWYAQSVFSSLCTKSEMRSELIARRCNGNMSQFADVLRAWGPGSIPSLWNRLNTLPMPVQWIAGEGDPLYTAMGERIHAVAPAVNVRSIAGAGHTVHLEQPDDLGHTISRFIINAHKGET